jgi:hypothetical protein
MDRLSVILFVGISLALAGCGKIREASEAVKSVSETMEAVKDVTAVAESAAKSVDAGEPVDLTEAAVRKYYTEIGKLGDRYPDIEFQSPVSAAMQASLAKKDLKKIIEGETRLGFDEYNALSISIVTAMAQGAAAGMTDEMINAMEEGIKQAESMDTSQMTAEQKTQIEQSLKEQRAALEKAKTESGSAEQREARADWEMIMRIREETGFEN